ncbi:MAG: hypothetical protein WDN49_26165 [Acetobacteraceae bacterium]
MMFGRKPCASNATSTIARRAFGSDGSSIDTSRRAAMLTRPPAPLQSVEPGA